MPDPNLADMSLDDLRARAEKLEMWVINLENTDRLGYQGIAELSSTRRELSDVRARIAELEGAAA